MNKKAVLAGWVLLASNLALSEIYFEPPLAVPMYMTVPGQSPIVTEYGAYASEWWDLFACYYEDVSPWISMYGRDRLHLWGFDSLLPSKPSLIDERANGQIEAWIRNL